MAWNMNTLLSEFSLTKWKQEHVRHSSAGYLIGIGFKVDLTVHE
jgi:hypothetical protein